MRIKFEQDEKVCIHLPRRLVRRDPAAIPPSALTPKAPAGMREEEADAKEAIKYILEFLSQWERESVRESSVVSEPTGIYASPEEGRLLIHSFVRIKQPQLRAAMIKLATQMANS